MLGAVPAGAHVVVEVVLAGKVPEARGAAEGPLARVRPHVVLHHVLAAKPPGAQRAVEGLRRGGRRHSPPLHQSGAWRRPARLQPRQAPAPQAAPARRVVSRRGQAEGHLPQGPKVVCNGGHQSGLRGTATVGLTADFLRSNAAIIFYNTF